jgi:hypothetical protein
VPETPTVGAPSGDGGRPVETARQLELPLPASGRRVARPPASRPARGRRPDPPADRRPSPPSRRVPTRGSTLPSGGPYRRLDERTRRAGLEGIAAARALLERARPIDTGDENGTGSGRAA